MKKLALCDSLSNFHASQKQYVNLVQKLTWSRIDLKYKFGRSAVAPTLRSVRNRNVIYRVCQQHDNCKRNTRRREKSHLLVILLFYANKRSAPT